MPHSSDKENAPAPSPVVLPSAPPSPGSPPSPDAARKGNLAPLGGTPSPPLSSVALADPCALYDLHHALQHRLVEDLGWSLHWYLDTETEAKKLMLTRGLGKKAKQLPHAGNGGAATDAGTGKVKDAVETGRKSESITANPPAIRAADQQSGSTPKSAQESSAPSPTSPPHRDHNTLEHHHALDVNEGNLPFATQESRFGVVTDRFDCYICHDLYVGTRPPASQIRISRLSRDPFEYRLASLQRWLRKRSAESARNALLASCLSQETQRYLAYLGLADCWTSLFVTAGLPAITPVVPTSPRASPCKTSPFFPKTLSAVAARSDRVPLSFYAVPALCRWSCIPPSRRDKILRESATHPFPLSKAFPQDNKRASPPQHLRVSDAREAQAATPDVSHSPPPLTFFTIQEMSPLPARRRSSNRPDHISSLSASCACDVYLIASAGAGSGHGAQTGDTVASVWGYVKRRDSDSQNLAPCPKSLSGELFYIASSVENYLRLGLALGWVYGWQMCFSSVGPPKNSVHWLRFMNSSAYSAALAASNDTTP
ncbi:hypothetical protein JKF63_03898 [Porcisia hertigi]|uniref:Uncharacterized protein n=1 Tax=Porcisia hertigi TaxID=2761500 RepID=A0A836LF27_9TRYP|nr:hypothetical protein JKF63_03898 [Porcisia hertigi]